MKKEKMKIALIGLKFNAKEAVSTASINLPELSEILSVKFKDDANILWLNFMAPSECLCKPEYYHNSKKFFFNSDNYANKTWCKFEFTFVRCSYDEFEFEIDEHRYIDTIFVGNDAFAIFYKKAE